MISLNDFLKRVGKVLIKQKFITILLKFINYIIKIHKLYDHVIKIKLGW